jgi:DNA-binding beta-propeller fold protein YncE
VTTVAASRITAVRPLWALEGGRVTIVGDRFAVDPLPPDVTIGGTPARLAFASTRALTALVPTGLDGGQMPVRVGSAAGETAYVDIGVPLATGLHQVDNPAFDAAGTLYVTFSGSRGQQPPVSVFKVGADGARVPFVSDLSNATSLAFDRQGRLHVSSRFDGSVHQIDAQGRSKVVATDLGVACGIAFGPTGDLFVGDRSGSVLRLSGERTEIIANLPPSVAAFHLAFGPDGYLYVAAPTISSSDGLYRISLTGVVERFGAPFGRPQGIAFDADGRLYVVDALAGSSGLFRVDVNRPSEVEQLLSGGSLIGLAFAPGGGLVVASTDTVYRFDVPLHGLLFS